MHYRSAATIRGLIATSGLAAGLAAGGALPAACANSSGGSSGSGPSGTGAGSSGTSVTSGALSGSSGFTGSIGMTGSSTGVLGGGSGTLGTTGSGSGSTSADGAAPTCASDTHKGTVIPVDIFIMMDQSGSMDDKVTGPNGTTDTKWNFVKQAFTNFVQDPASAGIGVGIQYFPIPNVDSSSCDAGTYSVTNDPNAPASGVGVGVATLPGNATAMVTSLNAHTPGGQTPTAPALTGALQYARNWQTQNPTHKVVVVLATDGDPHGCTNDTVDTVSAIAQGGVAGTPPIPTYVIGIGNALTDLNQIADAGGSGAALIINTAQDVSAQLLTAMNDIRSSASVPCVLAVPTGDGGAVDFTKVNVVDSPSDGGPQVSLYQVANAAACDPAAGGWFYDNPAAPATINLCPASCTSITAGVTDQVDIELGCATLVQPPPR